MKKITLINSNEKTRYDLGIELSDIPIEHFSLREVICHTKTDSEPIFVLHNKPLDLSDTVVYSRFHIVDPAFTGIFHEHLLHKKIPFINSINLIYDEGSGKMAQLVRFCHHQLPIPESIIVRKEAYDANKSYISDTMTYPIITKTNGRKGEGVHLIENETELEKYITSLPEKQRFIIQEFIPNTFDIRVLVAFGEIIGAITRSSKNSFLNNISQGGAAGDYTLTDQEKDIAIAAAEICSLDIAGVDIIHKNGTPVILEVNRSPGVLGFESVHTNMTVFEKIGRLIKSKYGDV